MWGELKLLEIDVRFDRHFQVRSEVMNDVTVSLKHVENEPLIEQVLHVYLIVSIVGSSTELEFDVDGLLHVDDE